MVKLKSTLPNILLSLTGICSVAGATLAGVNQSTASPTVIAKAIALEGVIKTVAPGFNNKPTEDVYMAVPSDGDPLKVHPTKKDGQVTGGAVGSSTKKGFSGEIRVIIGFDMDGRTLNYSVSQYAEAPGLGAKMQEWFRTDKNKQSVLGCMVSDGGLKVTKSGSNVDVIMVVTASSRVFLGVMDCAYGAFADVDGLTAPLQLIANKKGRQNDE